MFTIRARRTFVAPHPQAGLALPEITRSRSTFAGAQLCAQTLLGPLPGHLVLTAAEGGGLSGTDAQHGLQVEITISLKDDREVQRARPPVPGAALQGGLQA